ncbi:MAG: hypothetical protein ABIM64_05520 [candidate division WOR-3 bacterium]
MPPVKNSQNKKLLELLLDGKPHSTVEILKKVYGDEKLGLARISARIWDLEKKHGCVFLDEYGKEITEKGKLRCWKDKNHPTIYWYRLKVESYFNPKKTEKQQNQMSMDF